MGESNLMDFPQSPRQLEGGEVFPQQQTSSIELSIDRPHLRLGNNGNISSLEL